VVRSKSSVKYYAKQIKHIIMRKDVVYLGMIWSGISSLGEAVTSLTSSATLGATGSSSYTSSS
jgi:hypothetical protein